MPERPPFHVPELPDMQPLGKTSALAKDIEKESSEKIEELRTKAMAELEEREERGERDWRYKKQQLIPPERSNLENFEIDVAFGYTGNDGSQCIGWYSGVVKQVLNINKKTVKIEWDEDCLGDMDARVSVHQLLPNNWNLKVAKNGGW